MEEAFPPNQPAESEYPAVADEEEEEEDEEEQEQAAEAPPVVVATAAAKKRGRPAGSKNRAPDVYTALLDRMSQLEENLNQATQILRPRRVAPVEAPPAMNQVDLLLNQITQARDVRRQQQLDFYASFLT